MLAMVVGVVITTAILAVDLPAAGDGPQVIAGPRADVLGQVEVRERQAYSLDGRTTRFSDAAPGLTTADSALNAAPRGGVDSDSTSARTLGEEALEQLGYDWSARLPGWEVSFEGAKEGFRGLTFSGARRIDIYVRQSDSAADLARVLAHEIGHAVDVTHNNDSRRRLWRDARDIPDYVPWWPESGGADFESGAGDFAECFATWLVQSESLSQIAGACTETHLELIELMA